MDVGYGCVIDDKWIPNDVSTGLNDINGVDIKTRNIVSICGCTSESAVVGKSEAGFKLYFGSKNGSVEWSLNDRVIKNHKIRVIK